MQIINPGISLTDTVSALAYTSSNKTSHSNQDDKRDKNK